MTVEYAYHILPKVFIGNEIIPLNKLQIIDSELYKKAISK